jgi:hypothetical protein
MEVLRKQDLKAAVGRIKIRYHVVLEDEGRDYRCIQETHYSKSQHWTKLVTDGSTSQEWNVEGNIIQSSSNSNVIENRGTIKRSPWECPNGIGPLFIEGRGLSQIENVKITADQARIILAGKSKGRNIRAVLDPENSYVAKLIEILGPNGEVAYTYKNSKIKKDENGYVYASESRRDSTTFYFEASVESRATSKTQIVVPNWLSKNAKIVDKRVASPVGYSYSDILKANDGKEPTLDQLYKISLGMHERILARKQSDKLMVNRIESSRSNSRFMRILAVVGTLIVAVLVIFGARRLVRRV